MQLVKLKNFSIQFVKSFKELRVVFFVIIVPLFIWTVKFSNHLENKNKLSEVAGKT